MTSGRSTRPGGGRRRETDRRHRQLRGPDLRHHVNDQIGTRMDEGPELVGKPGGVTSIPSGRDGWDCAGSVRTGTLTPRPLAASVDDLLADAERLGPIDPDDARSGSLFERVRVDGEDCVVKYVHPDLDFTLRVSGDVGCRSRRVWSAGLMDLAPDLIDHAHLGMAPWGRNGWGAALLMRDVSHDLVAIGDDPLEEDRHLAFLDH